MFDIDSFDTPLDSFEEMKRWRDMCISEALSEVSSPSDNTKTPSLSSGVFRKTFLDSGLISDSSFVSRAFDVYRRSLSQASRTEFFSFDEDERFVPVEISLFRLKIPQAILSSSDLSSGISKRIEPVFARACMDDTGRLYIPASARVLPVPPIWLSSSVFENKSFFFGDSFLYHDFLRRYFERHACWPDSWQSCFALLNRAWAASRPASGDNLLDFLSQNNFSLSVGWVGIAQSTQTLPLVQTYDSLLSSEGESLLDSSSLRLLRRFSSGQGERGHWTGEGLSHYLGHPTPSNGLTSSQRVVVGAESFLGEGEMLSVTGAPGTGKSSLLLPLVASAYVRAAISHLEPPAILVPFDSFQESQDFCLSFSENLYAKSSDESSDFGVLSHRWFDVASGFTSLICPTAADTLTAGIGKGVSLSTDLFMDSASFVGPVVHDELRRDGSFDVSQLFRLASLPLYSKRWLEYASLFLDTPVFTVSKGQELLHERLLRLARNIHNVESDVARVEHRLESLRDYDSVSKLGSSVFFETVSLNVDSCISSLEHELSLFDTVSFSQKQESRLRERHLRDLEDEQISFALVNFSRIRDESLAFLESSLKIPFLQDVLARLRVLVSSLRVTVSESWITLLPWERNRRVSLAKELFLSSSLDLSLSPSVWDFSSVLHLIDLLDIRATEYERDIFESEKKLRSQTEDILRVYSENVSACKNNISVMRASRRDASSLEDETRRIRFAHLISERERHEDVKRSIRSVTVELERFRTEYHLSANQSPSDVRSILDTTMRYEAFLLSCRYWEGEFLKRVSLHTWSNSPPNRETLRLISCLFPILVGDVDSLCKILRVTRGRHFAPMWGYADLLFIDNASRQPLHRFASLFSFARRAIALGNPYEKPNIPASSYVFYDDSRTLLDWCAHASRFSRYDGSSLALTEQFTLPSELSNIVSKLWFDDTFVLPNTDSPQTPLAPFQSVFFSDSISPESAVLTWLRSHLPLLLAGYSLDSRFNPLPLSEILSIFCFNILRIDSLRNLIRSSFGDAVADSITFFGPNYGTHARSAVVLCLVEPPPTLSFDIETKDAIALSAIAPVIDSFVLFSDVSMTSERISALSRLALS